MSFKFINPKNKSTSTGELSLVKWLTKSVLAESSAALFQVIWPDPGSPDCDVVSAL